MQEPQEQQLSWRLIRHLALQHKRKIILANILAVLATFASVPIPLLLPLLVDEVLLQQPGKAIPFLQGILPAGWAVPVGFIASLLFITLVLRVRSLVLNVLQGRLFTQLAKNIVFQLRQILLGRLEHISMA